MTYKQKIFRGIEAMSHAILALENTPAYNHSRQLINDLWYAQDLLINPYQTLPKRHFIQITSSFCDKAGNSDKAHDHHISFEREISAALLYLHLDEHIKHYDHNWHIQCDINYLEDWLMHQKSLFTTVDKEYGMVQEEGLTVADWPTEWGSIDFFIEYGFCFPED